MPVNTQTDGCISREGSALVFWAPGREPRRPGSRVQIVDVFALQVATGYTRDPQGRLLLEAQPSLAAGRSWSLAKAMQLIRNDARPHRWVALQQNKHAWGLFWAGGGLQRCRELLADQVSEAEACSALVPATAEALLKLLLGLDPPAKATAERSSRAASGAWKLAALTSVGWLVVLGVTVAGFLGAVERQDRQIEQLLDRMGQPSQTKR